MRAGTCRADRILIATAAIATLGGCAAEGPPETAFEPVTSEETFRALAVGKRLDMVGRPGNYARLAPDGDLDGEFSGYAADGAWEWEDGRYCREFTVGTRVFPYACQEVQAVGDRIRFMRDDGTHSEYIASG
jgi:hypothetical protein